MSTAETRPSDGFGLWLLLATAAAVGVAVFAASRTKPPFLFAAGLGSALGIFLRMIADVLTVPLTRRVMLSVIFLAAAAFALTFGLGYRRQAAEWDKLHAAGPDNPLATALLKNFPDSDPEAMIAAQQRFTPADYLSRRVPDWPSPWPEVLCGAEWMLCMVIAGLCVGFQRWKRVEQNTPTHRAGRVSDGPNQNNRR